MESIDKFFNLPSNISMELQGLTPATIQCPHCFRKFYIATKSLTEGQARFQCTSCHAFFAMDWMRGGGEGEGEVLNTYTLEVPQQTKNCFKCQHICDEQAEECPACGVLFVKQNQFYSPTLRDQGVGVLKVWEKVKKDYGNEGAHLEFIKMCSEQNQLLYAAQQYRAILMVNPNEVLAQKMQKIILDMVEAQEVTDGESSVFRKIDFYKVIVLISLLFVVLGFAFDQLRHLVAFGSSILFFALIFKHWIAKSEV